MFTGQMFEFSVLQNSCALFIVHYSRPFNTAELYMELQKQHEC